MLKIYHCDISKLSDNDLFDMYQNLDETRKQKADKIKNETQKKLSIASGDLAMRGISACFNIDKSDIRFLIDKNGKPYIEKEGIEFSISHSGDFGVCAVSDCAVGVDIEKISNVDLNIAKRVFTDDEIAYVDGQKERFFEIWTKKEAYAKMMGAGVAHFREFSVIGNENIKTYINDGYVLSVVTQKK